MSGQPTSTDASAAPKPVLQVITPDATPEEVAAIVAVLSALGGGAPAPAPARAEWSHPHRLVRHTGYSRTGTGTSSWRSSGLPH